MLRGNGGLRSNLRAEQRELEESMTEPEKQTPGDDAAKSQSPTGVKPAAKLIAFAEFLESFGSLTICQRG
jgi:hypothetical protein